jgi:hypothetical protein
MIDVVDKPRQGTLDPKLGALLEDKLHEQKGYVHACARTSSATSTTASKCGQPFPPFVNPHGIVHVGCYAKRSGARSPAADGMTPVRVSLASRRARCHSTSAGISRTAVELLRARLGRIQTD